MHRRKAESLSQYKAERWGRGNKKGGGLFAKRSSLPNDAKCDEASATEPTSAGSSSVVDFDLPTWEKPQDAVSTEKYSQFVSPTKPTRQSGVMGYHRMPNPIPKFDSPVSVERLLKSAQTLPAQPENDLLRESGDELTDMVVTCNTSFNSLGDDITFMSIREQEEQKTKQARRKRHGSPRRRAEPPDGRSSNKNILTRNARCLSPMKHPVSIPESPSSPRGGPPKKNFIWKKGPNGRYLKVPVDGDVVPGTAQSQRTQPPTQFGQEKGQNDEALERMEEEMLNRVLELSKQEDQTSLQATSPTVRAAPLQRHSVPDESTASSQFQDRQSSNSLNTASHSASVEVELDGQEEALIHLAVERSMRDVTLQFDSHLPRPTGSATQLHGDKQSEESVDRRSLYASTRLTRSNEQSGQSRVLYLGGDKSAPQARNTRVGFLHQPSVSTSSSPHGASKNFVWKKGPNNRYVKRPIGMDQLDEDREVEEFTPSEQPNDRPNQANGSLAQMEEVMLQEAMKRSMRDLYSGL